MALWPLAAVGVAPMPPVNGAPGPASHAAAVTPAGGCGLQEFWIVNTRGAPTCRGLERGIEQIRYVRRVGKGAFTAQTRDEFVARVDATLPTLIFVHGNSLDYDQAIKAGERLAEAISPRAPAYRFVLWSWPADHIRGLSVTENVRVKAGWSEAQGYYLAWLIDRLDPNVPLSLAGYSLGARTVTAALAGLASGQVAGHALAKRLYPGPRPVQAALIAPAMESRLLLPDGRHSQALAQVDRMLITVNPLDRTLKRFAQKTSSRAALLGMSGLPRNSQLGDQRFKIRETVLTPWLGGAHAWRKYTNSSEIMAQLRPYLVYQDMPVTSDGS